MQIFLARLTPAVLMSSQLAQVKSKRVGYACFDDLWYSAHVTLGVLVPSRRTNDKENQAGSPSKLKLIRFEALFRAMCSLHS